MTIPHDKLLTLSRTGSRGMLRIIKQSLKVGVDYQGKVSQLRWSPARVTDFTAIQQHLPKSNRYGIQQRPS